MFWGYAPALDLLRELEKSKENDSKVKKKTKIDKKEDESWSCSVVGNDGKCSYPSADDGGSGAPVASDGNGGVLERTNEQSTGKKEKAKSKIDEEFFCLGDGSGENVARDSKGENGAKAGNEIEGAAGGGGSENAAGKHYRREPRTYEEAAGDIRRDAGEWRQNSKDSFDVLHGLSESNVKSSSGLVEEKRINILLVGSCDARHIFKTLSRVHYHAENPSLRFYVLDPLMEMVARQLLLIYAASQSSEQLGHKEKVRLLMEIIGNTLIRPVTASWITKAAKIIQKMVTNETVLRQKLPQIRLDKLKYRERDQLEDICAFWQERPQNFRIGYHWDERLRKTLKTRYDSRANIFDWDYYMVLKELERGDRICMKEYKNWRSSGVAFTWLEVEPSVPNVTLATGIFREGNNLLHHGYLGDLKISPYIAYSTEVEPEDEKDMWVKRNDGYTARSTDVAERHLSRITYEMVNQRPYRPPAETTTNINGIIITQITDSSHLNPEAPPEDDDDPTRTRRTTYEIVPDTSEDLNDDTGVLPTDAEITFLSCKFFRDTGGLGRFFSQTIDIAVVASVLAEAHVHDDLLSTIRDDGLLLVEGNRFHLLRKTEREHSSEKLVEKITSVGFQLEGEYDCNRDDYIRFRARR